MTKISKRLRTSLPMRVYRMFIKNRGRKMTEQLKDFIDTHFDSYSPEQKKRVLKDIRKEFILRGYTCEEYWQFKFDLFSKEQRKTMVPILKINRFYDSINSEEGCEHLLFDKWKTYQLFKDLYKREACLIRFDKEKGGYFDEDINTFKSFVSRNPVFVIKPLFLDSGIGVKKLSFTNEDDWERLLDQCPNDDFMAEGFVVESYSLAKYNPCSVNTLRTNTVYYNDDDIEIFRPIMRFGNGEVLVDNAHFGGLYAVVDPHSGLMTHAGDLDRHLFPTHPYTGVPIVGEFIPDWEGACELSREAARRLPDHVFTGWDLALTDDGWVLIEGNAKPGLLDSAMTGVGPKEEFKRIKQKRNRQ